MLLEESSHTQYKVELEFSIFSCHLTSISLVILEAVSDGSLVERQKRGTVKLQSATQQKSFADTEEFKAPSLPAHFDSDEADQINAVQWRFRGWLHDHESLQYGSDKVMMCLLLFPVIPQINGKSL